MLLEFTTQGIYCQKGNFYIDPSKGVDYALITHAHSDHASRGSKHYLTHEHSAPILKLRLGKKIDVQTVKYGKELNINGVKVTFFPSGHVVGSSQIRVSDGVETWIATGDYKLEDDGITTPFEHVECTHFITESTFAKPMFEWKPQKEIITEINDWWKLNKENNIASVISAYSLGKSQRIIKNVDESIGKIIVHKTIKDTNNVIEAMGYKLPKTILIDDAKPQDFKNALILAPSMSSIDGFLKNIPTKFAQASGWMQVGWFMPKTLDKGFVLSDHADWNGLLKTIEKTTAKNIYINHGYTSSLAKYLNSIGYNATPVKEKNLNQLRLI